MKLRKISRKSKSWRKELVDWAVGDLVDFLELEMERRRSRGKGRKNPRPPQPGRKP
ncbi:MAG TPA: hypothetical protein VIM58_05290 [Candidatus Methylacidiphilales bacterium]